jgi:tripartite-type tricarboxylate transporter receptor subunit TctC
LAEYRCLADAARARRHAEADPRLNKDVNAAVHSSEMKTPLERLGMIGLGDKSLKQLDDYVKSETVHWAKIIENANLAGTQ